MRSGCSRSPHWRKATGRWNPARVLAMLLLLGMAACAPGSAEKRPTAQEPPQEALPAGEPSPGNSPSGTVDSGQGATGNGSAVTGNGSGEAPPVEPDFDGVPDEIEERTASPETPLAFPWPPPKPSSLWAISEELLPRPNGQVTLGDVGARFRQTLERQGYTESAWFPTPNGDGFILFTRMEQFHSDGTPFQGLRRFLPEVTRDYRSLSDFLQALFMAPPGRFRVIALVVVPGDLPRSEKPLDRAQADALLQGPQRLDKKVAQQPFTSDHNAYALVYEFTKRRSEKEGKFVSQSALSAYEHLRAAGLVGALREARP